MGRDRGRGKQNEPRSVQPSRNGRHRTTAGDTQADDQRHVLQKLEADSEVRGRSRHNARKLIALAPASIAVGILIGGEQHFGTGFFDFQRRYAPWWAWATVFILCSLWMVLIKDTDNMFWCALVSSMVMALWTLSTLLSILRDESGTAPTASVGLYALVSFYLAFVAGRSDRPGRKK